MFHTVFSPLWILAKFKLSSYSNRLIQLKYFEKEITGAFISESFWSYYVSVAAWRRIILKFFFAEKSFESRLPSKLLHWLFRNATDNWKMKIPNNFLKMKSFLPFRSFGHDSIPDLWYESALKFWLDLNLTWSESRLTWNEWFSW